MPLMLAEPPHPAYRGFMRALGEQDLPTEEPGIYRRQPPIRNPGSGVPRLE